MSAERQVTDAPSPLSLAMYCSQIPATFVPRTPCDTTLRLMNASVPDNDPVYSEPFFSLFPCRSTRFSRVCQESAARQWRLGKSNCLCRMSSTTVPTHQGFLGCATAFPSCRCRCQARTSLGFHLVLRITYCTLQ